MCANHVPFKDSEKRRRGEAGGARKGRRNVYRRKNASESGAKESASGTADEGGATGEEHSEGKKRAPRQQRNRGGLASRATAMTGNGLGRGPRPKKAVEGEKEPAKEDGLKKEEAKPQDSPQQVPIAAN